MKIYTKENEKVVCVTFNAGYELEKELAKKHLKIGGIYTVDCTNVDSWHTSIYLKEIPNVAFNSVFFENI